MVNKQVNSASLTLNPPELGPVKIHLSVERDQAFVNFSSEHQVVRQAIEVAIPKLQEMLAQSDIELVDVAVSDYERENGRADRNKRQ